MRAARNLQANTPPCIVSPRSRLLSERTSRSQELQTCRNTFFNVSNDPVNAVTDMPSIYLIRRLPPRSVHSNPSQAWSKTELSLLVYGTSQVDISEARPVTAFGSKNGGCFAKKTLTLSWPRCERRAEGAPWIFTLLSRSVYHTDTLATHNTQRQQKLPVSPIARYALHQAAGSEPRLRRGRSG